MQFKDNHDIPPSPDCSQIKFTQVFVDELELMYELMWALW